MYMLTAAVDELDCSTASAEFTAVPEFDAMECMLTPNMTKEEVSYFYVFKALYRFW